MSKAQGRRVCRAVLVGAVTVGSILAIYAAAEPKDSGLYLRRRTGKTWAEEKHAIPRDAVQVFTYEGAPRRVHFTAEHTAADYGVSGVLFDAETGKLVRRYTLLDGWPARRPSAFGPAPGPEDPVRMIPPGLVPGNRRHRQQDRSKPLRLYVTARVRFRGRTFRAKQPALYDLLCSKDYGDLRSWNAYLKLVGRHSTLHAEHQGKVRRYTTADGLPGRIVSHLAVADDTLWAACVDVYDEQKKAWGAGGLARYDPAADRWLRVRTIAGRPVRWVTLLQAHGGDLWVGFRRGAGLVGQWIVYGMAIYMGQYRPIATSVVLARVREGRWRTWSRAPIRDPVRARWGGEPAKGRPPTETPCALAVVGRPGNVDSQQAGRHVMLFSTTLRSHAGDFHQDLTGHVSRLDLQTGRWQRFDTEKDIGAGVLTDLYAGRGQVIVTEWWDAYRWNARQGRWHRLVTGCALQIPWFGAVAAVGEDLWVGYSAPSLVYSGRKGLSRYSGRTGQWTFRPAKTLGTDCDVKRIVPGPDGEVWVLFGWRWLGGDRWFARWPASRGLGRMVNGEWEFPARLPGVPNTVRRLGNRALKPSSKPADLRSRAHIYDVASVGDAFFVANHVGVFVGPGAWKKIHHGGVSAIRATHDPPGLIIDANEQYHYDVRSGKLRVRRAEPDRRRFTRITLGGDPYDRRPFYPRGGLGGWASVSASRPGEWFIGPVSKGRPARAIPSPGAIWIASPGQLLRIDRRGPPKWAGAK